MAGGEAQSFMLGFARFKPDTTYRQLHSIIYTGQGRDDNFCFVRWIIGDNLDYGHLFAYLFRRFGYPNSGWDECRQLVKYDLSTPLPDLVMRITPHVGNSSTFSICFLIAYEPFFSIKKYQYCEKAAYQKRMFDWIEARGMVPDWMPECVATASAELQLITKSWREIFDHLIFYRNISDDVPDCLSKRAWYQWSKAQKDQYEKIEAKPGHYVRKLNWKDWPEDDPLKRYIAAAQTALGDLKRPVRVHEQAINAFGKVQASALTLKEPAVAGYPSGHLGNLAPKEFAVLHEMILRLGNGNAKHGIAKVMASVGNNGYAS